MEKRKAKELDKLMERFYNEERIDFDKEKKTMDILLSEGHLKHVGSMNGSTYRLTDKGKGFYLLGGYRKEESRKTSRYIRDVTVAITSSIITSLIQVIL